MSNIAVDEDGQRKYDKRVLALSSTGIGLLILFVYPIRLLPSPWFVDTVLHFLAGVSFTLLFATLIPKEDHKIATAVVILGVIWEPIEMYHFYCTQGEWFTIINSDFHGKGQCTYDGFSSWMAGDDTVKDIGYVWVGTLLTLILIDRYE